MYSQFSLTELLMTLTDEIAYLNARLAPCFNCSLVYQAGRKYFKTSVGTESTVFVQVNQSTNFGYLLCARYVVRDQKYYHKEVKVLRLCWVGALYTCEEDITQKNKTVKRCENYS